MRLTGGPTYVHGVIVRSMKSIDQKQDQDEHHLRITIRNTEFGIRRLGSVLKKHRNPNPAAASGRNSHCE